MPVTRICQASDEAGTWRTSDGNPRGESIDTRIYTGKPAFTYNTNTAGVSSRNFAALVDHYNASPSSGVNLELDGFVVIDKIYNPKRVIGGREQHLAFAMRGRAGTTVLLRDPSSALEFTRPAYTSHRPSGVSGILIENIDFLTKGRMLFSGLGQELWLNNVIVISDSIGCAIHLNEIYAGAIGRVKALDCSGDGFLITKSNQLIANQLQARGCDGDGISVSDSQEINIDIDCEGNKGFALSLEKVRDSHFNGWIEAGPRVSLTKCEGITHRVNGWRIDHADRHSMCLCPGLFPGIKRTEIVLSAPLNNGSRVPLPGLNQCGCEFVFRVSGTPATNDRMTTIQINSNGSIPAQLQVFTPGDYKMTGFIESTPGVMDYLERRDDAGSSCTVEVLSAVKLEPPE